MKKYIIKRLMWMIFVLLGVLFIVFVLLEFTPGDPARQILGAFADEKDVAAKRIELGLDDPFLVRFLDMCITWSSILTLGYHTVLSCLLCRDCFKVTHNYDHWRSWPFSQCYHRVNNRYYFSG